MELNIKKILGFSSYNTYMTMSNKNKGFTLVELSIVIVIIGLIVAGVVGGQTLVKQAKLRQVLSQMNKIKVAVNAYRLEYGELPGDHSRAADYWGQAANCYADTTGSTNTCNGDGSKFLAYVWSGDTSNVEYEPWHFWKHLENAKVFQGNFTGYSDNTKCSANNYCSEPGINMPKSAINGTGFNVLSFKTSSSDLSWQGRSINRTRNILAFVRPGTATNAFYGPGLTTSQQYSIDSKIDDGLPYQGYIVDISGSSANRTPNCATANSNEFGNNPPGTTTINATYDLSYKEIACTMFVDLE